MLVLASSSIVRARLLESAGATYDVVPARIDEEAVKSALVAEHAPPQDIAGALAEMKALRVAASRPDALVVGADQVLVFEEMIIGKSGTLAEAKVLLRRLRGNRHALYCAAVVARNGAIVWRHVERADLWMRPFGDDFLDSYLSREGEDVLGSVGCYRLEGLGVQLFSQVKGDYFSILGLPLLPLLAALREQGAIAT